MDAITTIDCEYIYPQFAAAFLLSANGRGIFVENNTAHSVPKLLAALKQAGLKTENVDYLIVTHVHLDHAGGTSALLKHCPGARVLAHPKAARHLRDPSRLIASAQAVYGKEKFEKLYGSIEPIAVDRVQEMQDEEVLDWQGRTFRFLHTRGHANHHFCVVDEKTRSIFTGDAFGLAYPALQQKGLLIFPSTSPTDFDVEEAKTSVIRIAASGAQNAYLTHFGKVSVLANARDQLLRHLDFHQSVLVEARSTGFSGQKLVDYCEARLRPHFEAILPKPELFKWVEFDLKLNAAGLASAIEKDRR